MYSLYQCYEKLLLLSSRRIALYHTRIIVQHKSSRLQRKLGTSSRGIGSEAPKVTEHGEISAGTSFIIENLENEDFDAVKDNVSIDEARFAEYNHTSEFSILTLHPSFIEKIRNVDILERFVDEVESIKPLRSEHLAFIYPLMLATSNQASVNGANLTERLLAACVATIEEDRSKEPIAKRLPYPSRVMYNLAITAWIKARTANGFGAKRATILLELMAKEYKREVDYVNRLDQENELRRPIMAYEPHLINYSSVIDSWAKSDTDDAPVHAEQLLHDLEQMSGIDKIVRTGITEGELHHLAPDLICYNTVMSAWSRSKYQEAISKIEEIVQRLKTLYKITGDAGYRPDVHTYTILIDAYSKQRGLQKINRPMDAERVLIDMYNLYTSRDRIIGERSVRPNIIAYNNVMQAWVNALNPERAESILMTLMGKKAKITTVPVIPRITPTLISFNIVINGWARYGGPCAGERAEAVLGMMDHVKDADGISTPIEPTTLTLNTVMNAWSRSHSAVGAERAEIILNSLICDTRRNQPTSISFATVIHAHAMSGAEHGAQRAEQVLHKQQLYYNATKNEGVSPSEPSYVSVLLAWNLRSANEEQIDGLYCAEHAEALLGRYETATGKKPSLEMFQGAIEAWSRHDPNGVLVDGPNKVDRARLLLSRVVDELPMELAKNSMSFSIMLRVCSGKVSNAKHRREAFFTAIDTYNRLQRDPRFPRHLRMYVEMFKVLKIHLPETRDSRYMDLAETIFQDCCRDGLLCPPVVEAALACNHLPNHLHILLSGDRKEWSDNWSRLVRPNRPNRGHQ